MTIICRCGCGTSFTPSRATQWRIAQGKPVGYLTGHGQRGANNPRWKGGSFLTPDNYVLVKAPAGHPYARKSGYILQHRLLAEQLKGSVLLPSEIVHHKNGNTQDNRLENLALEDRVSHGKYHHEQRRLQYKKNQPRPCIRCKKLFIASHNNHERNKYCSRACAFIKGEQAFNARFTDAQINAVRMLVSQLSHRQLGKKFGISKTHIGRILHGASR